MEQLQPFEVWGQKPTPQPATILGARTRTEFYRIREDAIAANGAISAGAEIEFTKNSVVTGILCKSDQARPDTLNLGIQVVKDGTEHLCTNGFEPVRFSPCSVAACFDPWFKCWIPTNMNEIWKVNCQNNLEDTASYSFVIRVERFLEKPPEIPRYLTQTVLYQVGDTTAGNSSSNAGQEWDFRTNGIVSGLRAVTNLTPAQSALLSNLELDILLDGQTRLSNAKQTISPIDVSELSPVPDPWFPLRYAVKRHDKWQIFAANVGAVERIWRLMARVEEARVPWDKW